MIDVAVAEYIFKLKKIINGKVFQKWSVSEKRPPPPLSLPPLTEHSLLGSM